MNKMYLAKKAKELCQIERLNADEIAKRLGISRRTIFNWMKQFDWKKLPPQPLQLCELQKAASLMMKSIERDTEGKLNKNAINEMVKFFDYVLEEEKAALKQQGQNPKEKSTTIPNEIMDQIESDILGLRQNDEDF